MDREKEPVSISEFPGVSEPLDIVRFLKSHLEYSPYTSAIVVGTVGGAVLFQTIFRKLEAWVEGKRHAQEVLQLIFKELVSHTIYIQFISLLLQCVCMLLILPFCTTRIFDTPPIRQFWALLPSHCLRLI